MKKILVILSIAVLITGCGVKNIMNTPTKKVEMFFENYQTLNDDVMSQLNTTVDNEERFNEQQKEDYKSLMKRHYQNLTYEIKDEVIDGDTATVTVEINVFDYSKAMKESDVYLQNNKNEFLDENQNYDEKLFMTYQLNKLIEVKDKVKFTLELTLSKINDEWKIDDISDENQQKINGIFNY
ncbi:MAG: hypothetical protein PHN42_03820 [Bacilli bacterium]|nr:hypothetical protein [Bacilli bacterium]